MGKCCWIAIFPIQIHLPFPIFLELLSSNIFPYKSSQYYRPQTWHFYLFFPALSISSIHLGEVLNLRVDYLISNFDGMFSRVLRQALVGWLVSRRSAGCTKHSVRYQPNNNTTPNILHARKTPEIVSLSSYCSDVLYKNSLLIR